MTNGPVDISPADLASVWRILRDVLPRDTAIWVFGSRAKWTTRKASDLDLAVDAGRPLTRREEADLSDQFEQSDIPYKVDVVDWHGISASFRRAIEKDRVRLPKMETESKRRSGKRSGGAASTPSEWREYVWGDLATLEYGRALRGYNSGTGDFQVYGTNGPIGWHKEALCPRPGVIVGRKGVYRGVHYSPKPFFVIDTAFYLEPRIDLNVRWAYYALLALDINSLDSGSAIPSTTRDSFYRLPVWLPPRKEQDAIAHILGTLDDKIELNRRMSETLEAMARALFKSWFVDFDPVRAKAEGRDTGPPKQIADLFPDSFVESELGEIPEGWGIGPLTSQAAILSGGTPKTDRPAYWCGDFPWASARDVSQADACLLLETERTITERGLRESATQLIPQFSTVIVARGATTGRMAMLGREMAMNQTCYALSSTTNTPFALYCRLRQAIPSLVHAAHGSVFDTVTIDTFRSSVTVLPPARALQTLETLIRPVFGRMLECEIENRVVSCIRDTLLPLLLSGRLRVQELSAA